MPRKPIGDRPMTDATSAARRLASRTTAVDKWPACARLFTVAPRATYPQLPRR